MNSILFITSGGKGPGSIPEGSGFQVHELNSSGSSGELEAGIADIRPDHIVVELTDANLDGLEWLLQGEQYRNRLVCMAGELTDSIRAALFSNGIVDVWPSQDPGRIAEYLRAISMKGDVPVKKIVAFEKDPAVMRILFYITRRFGYSSVFFDSVEGLCSAMEDPDAECVLLNLGCGIDGAARLVKALHGCSGIKSRPFLAYRDMRQGVSVHEFMNGLNRITRVVMSHEELYSFLVDFLPRKQIMTMIGDLGDAVDLGKNCRYTCETLGQIYFQEQGDVFENDGCLSTGNIEDMLILTGKIRESLLRAEGLSWMKMKPEINRVNISEAGG